MASRSLPMIRDSRGRKSWMVTLVVIGYGVLLVKYAVSGWLGQPAMSGIDFSTPALALLGAFWGREYTEKVQKG